MPRLPTPALGALLAVIIAAPAMAAPTLISTNGISNGTSHRPSTRLVECGATSCLLVSGHREDAASPVSINGHAVAVEGARKWRARVPVETVRAWSAPYARTIAVSVAGASQDARLPIGLLGQVENLAMLVIRLK